jgi:hypothetical protein
MELNPNPALVATIRAFKDQGRHSAEILRYLAKHGLTSMEMMVQVREAFDLPWSDVSCIQGWWLDEGDLTDSAINALLDPVIAGSAAPTR